MNRLKISLILPAHNEEGNIKNLTEQIFKLCGKDIFEIIIVDDRSTDKTGEIADKLARKYKKVKVIHRKITQYNKNRIQLGLAIREGYKVSKGNQIMSIDTDFAMIPNDIKRVIDKFREGVYDVVVGSRFINGSKLINYPFDKLVSNRIFHFIFKLLLGVKVNDLSNNFKIMKKNVVKNIKWKSEGFSILAETGIMPTIRGYKICEVPVTWRQRKYGKSKFKVFSLAPSYIKIGLHAFYEKYFK